MKPSPTILIVEDEVLIALSLKVELTRAGYSVCGMATRGEEAIAMAARLLPQGVLMDVRLAGPMDGYTAAQKIVAAQQTAIIFVSGYMDTASLAKAAEFSPLACLNKPVSLSQIKTALQSLMK